jgi:predicted transcriptional regulator
LCESLKDYSGTPLTWGSILRLARENGIDPGEESSIDYKTIKKEVPWCLHPYTSNDSNTLTVEKAFQVPSLILIASKSGYNKTLFSLILGNQFSSMSVGEQLSPVLAQYHPARDVRTLLLECDMDSGMLLAYCQDLLLVPHGVVKDWAGWINKNFLVHRPTSEEMQSIDQMELFIKSNKFELVIIDTLFSAFSLDYNKPQECRLWLKRLRALATSCGCCIILLHHERKKSGAEKIANIASDMDSVYGSVSLVAGIDACLSITMQIMSETERVYDITCLKPRVVFPNFRPVQARSEKKYTKPSEPLGPSYPYYDIKFTVEPKLPDPVVVRNILVDLYKRETDRGDMPSIIRRSGISVAGFYRLLNVLKEYDYILEKSGGRWTRYIFTRKGLDIIEGRSAPDLIKNKAIYEDRLYGEALFERTLTMLNNRHFSAQTKTGFEHLAASALMRYPEYMEIVKKDMIISSLLANKKAADTPFLCCCRSKMFDKPIEGLSQQDVSEIEGCNSVQVSEQMFRDLLEVFKSSEDWLELTPSEFSHKVNNRGLPAELPKEKDATCEIMMDISNTIPLDL